MNKAEKGKEYVLSYRDYVTKDQQRAIGALVFEAVDVDMSPRSFFKDDDGEEGALRAITFEFSDRSRLRVILEQNASSVWIADAVVLPSKGEY